MTVEELIAELEKIENKKQEVVYTGDSETILSVYDNPRISFVEIY